MAISRDTTFLTFTSTTLGATGASTLVSAPGTNEVLEVFHIHAVNRTNTTGFIELSFRDGAAGNLMFPQYSQSIGLIFDMDLTIPWRLTSAQAMQCVLSVTAASTPSVLVTVGYVTTRIANP